jgi:hypothetical protein
VRLITYALLWAACVMQSGCGLHGPYRYVTTKLTLLDAETSEPICGAGVRVGYSSWPTGPVLPPAPDSSVTDEKGQAFLRATTDSSRDAYPSWRTEADGYFGTLTGGEAGDPTEAIAGALARRESGPPIEFTFRRFARPNPTVMVVVPDGYRGYVRVCPPQGEPEPTAEAHPRYFEIEIDEHGRAQMPLVAVLTQRLFPKHIRFRFKSGAEIPSEHSNPPGATRLPTSGDALGAWGLWYYDHCSVFVIADETTAAAERHALWPHGVLESGTMPAFQDKVRRGPFPSK